MSTAGSPFDSPVVTRTSCSAGRSGDRVLADVVVPAEPGGAGPVEAGFVPVGCDRWRIGAVSSANVDLVRSSFEAFGRGDFEQAFAAYDPAVEWCTADDEPDSAHVRRASRRCAGSSPTWPTRGPTGSARRSSGATSSTAATGSWRRGPARLHGHGSGIEIDVSETYAVLVRDGRITRVDEYRTVEQALAAVGKEKRPRRESRGRFRGRSDCVCVSLGGSLRRCPRCSASPTW